MKTHLVIVGALLLASTPSHAANRTIVGTWAPVPTACTPVGGMIEIGPMSLTGDELACRFENVDRSGEAQQIGRFFDPAPDGELMAWVDVFASDAETPIDCVAWPIERPDTVLTLGGVAVALGEAAAVNPATYSFGGALHLHRTPLAWLQAGCEGAVILDASAGARWLLDQPAPRIAAEDDAHAREIMRARQALTERQTIVVPQGRRRLDREAA